MFFGILALAIQCFGIQTHIHASQHVTAPYVTGSGPTGLAVEVSSPNQDTNLDGRSNPADDSANCLLCWEVAHGSHFVLPVTVSVLPLRLESFAVLFRPIVPPTATASHNGRVRGPPAV
jgi:hypothetical protein